MSAFLSFRCLVTAKLLAAVLLAAAPIDASRAANLLINGKTGKCLTIAGGTSPANNLTAVQFDCDGDLSRTWLLKDVGGAFRSRMRRPTSVSRSPRPAPRTTWRPSNSIATAMCHESGDSTEQIRRLWGHEREFCSRRWSE